jgi:hypothetical protein
MTIKVLAAIAVIACFACSTPTQPTEELYDPQDEVVAPPVERMITPTPAMVAAALSGDPKVMASAITVNACQSSTTCPPEFGACTNWSASEECAFSCGSLCRCIFTPEGDCEPEVRGRSTFNSFRICFDPSGNGCTQWRQTISTFCGC